MKNVYFYLKKSEIDIFEHQNQKQIKNYNKAVAIFKILNDKSDSIDVIELRKITFGGTPSIKSSGAVHGGGDLRAIVWRVLMGVLDTQPSTW